MFRKSLPLLLVLTLVGLLGAAVATAAGPTDDPRSSTSSTGEGDVRIRVSMQTEGGAVVFEALGYEHSVVSPRDAASGLPTGKRQHKPLVVTKPVDKSTPILFAILTQNENIPAWKMELVRTSPAGKEQVYYTIELENASIAGIQQERDAESALQPREHVSFTYQKITWTWTDGGITAEDDWETPTVRLFGLDAAKPAA